MKRNGTNHRRGQEPRRPSLQADPFSMVGTLLSTSFMSGLPPHIAQVICGHVSAAMSLRYGRLFDAAVKEEYERPLTLAKQGLGATPGARTSLALTDITGGADWKDAPLIKSRLSGGVFLRRPAQ